jgi:hypothetical protein
MEPINPIGWRYTAGQLKNELNDNFTGTSFTETVSKK